MLLAFDKPLSRQGRGWGIGCAVFDLDDLDDLDPEIDPEIDLTLTLNRNCSGLLKIIQKRVKSQSKPADYLSPTPLLSGEGRSENQNLVLFLLAIQSVLSSYASMLKRLSKAEIDLERMVPWLFIDRKGDIEPERAKGGVIT